MGQGVSTKQSTLYQRQLKPPLSSWWLDSESSGETAHLKTCHLPMPCRRCRPQRLTSDGWYELAGVSFCYAISWNEHWRASHLWREIGLSGILQRTRVPLNRVSSPSWPLGRSSLSPDADTPGQIMMEQRTMHCISGVGRCGGRGQPRTEKRQVTCQRRRRCLVISCSARRWLYSAVPWTHQAGCTLQQGCRARQTTTVFKRQGFTG